MAARKKSAKSARRRSIKSKRRYGPSEGRAQDDDREDQGAQGHPQDKRTDEGQVRRPAGQKDGPTGSAYRAPEGQGSQARGALGDPGHGEERTFRDA